MADRRRVVVVGGGHNGLVCACYLAAAGLVVTVVERDGVLGGAVSTVERFPGYRVDRGSSVHIMVRQTGIIEELELQRHGLEYQDLDPWGYAPFPDGALTFWLDLDRTCAGIEQLCGGKDADSYHRFATTWGKRNRRVRDAFHRPPTAGSLARMAWGHGRGSGVELARQFLTSADALLDENFDDERLKTALGWLAAQAGPPPHEPATAELLTWNMLLHQDSPGHPVGGSGRLTEALASRLAELGGQVLLADGAAEILAPGGRVSGVRLKSGAEVPADAVVTACDVGTAVRLLASSLDPALAEKVRRVARPGNGVGMAVRLATTDLPRYPGADDTTFRSMQLLATGRDQLRAAYGDYLAGRPPARPPVLAMVFSAFDRTLAPPGRHTVTLWSQWHPYQLADGQTWPAIAESEGARLVAAVDRAAPGFEASVQAMYVQTPLALEQELGLPAGQVMHLDMSLPQLFAWRPVPELAGYRFPGVAGGYLCGASTHPGGGVSGASGRNCARVVLRDLAPRRWRRQP